MTVHTKLMQARIKLQETKLSKSGHNKFAGYQYFELGDFLPSVQMIFADMGLCGVVSYAPDIATLTITDVESGTELKVTSPMSTAALKGCHEVQNLGAVQTYIRRYLWVTALEIVEHDALDMTTGKGEKKAITPTDGAINNLTPDQQIAAQDDANYIVQQWTEGDKVSAFDAYMTLREGDQEYLTAVWAFLKPHSSIRSGLKEMFKSKESSNA